MKLTPAMLKALEQMLTSYGSQSVRFQTGEALRRRGLADRLSTYVLKREYVTQDDTIDQFSSDVSAKNPVVWHEWYITQAGKWVLRDHGCPHVPR